MELVCCLANQLTGFITNQCQNPVCGEHKEGFKMLSPIQTATLHHTVLLLLLKSTVLLGALSCPVLLGHPYTIHVPHGAAIQRAHVVHAPSVAAVVRISEAATGRAVWSLAVEHQPQIQPQQMQAAASSIFGPCQWWMPLSASHCFHRSSVQCFQVCATLTDCTRATPQVIDGHVIPVF